MTRYGEMDAGGWQQAVSVGVSAGGYRAMLLTGVVVAAGHTWILI